MLGATGVGTEDPQAAHEHRHLGDGEVEQVGPIDEGLRRGEAMAGLPDDRTRLRAGIRAVLDFSSADPRRGKILFTEARTNPVLAERRAATQELLRKSVLDEEGAAPASTRTTDLVGAAMYAGAMAELAQQWLSGSLGDDLDAVVEAAVRVLMPVGAPT